MTILTKSEIRNACIPHISLSKKDKDNFKPLVSPFEQRRASRDKEKHSRLNALLLDEDINYGYDLHADFGDSGFIIPPKSFVIVQTLEFFNIPKNINGIVYGKKGIRKLGLASNICFLNPRYNGQLKIKINNFHRYPIRLSGIKKISRAVFYRNDIA